MLTEKIKQYKIILASGSPRRQKLLKELGFDFEIRPVDIDENYPAELEWKDIALYLSELKARAFNFDKLCKNCLVITADTIVWKDGAVLHKPNNYKDAVNILKILSGRMHEVITAVTLRTATQMQSFYVVTKVYFKPLSDEEISWYVSQYKPYDKAGAYGGQEWIGLIGIEKIEGSWYNIVGLPVFELYKVLQQFI